MIQIEPDAATSANYSAIKMRALRGFLSKAKSAIGLEGEVSVLLATDESIRVLNRDFRKKNKATDILSFPAAEPELQDGSRLAGDLAIALGVASRQAEEHGHGLQVELKILLLHGLLHLAGYDHETDSGEMARKESALRQQLGLPAGLIQRSGKKAVKQAAGRIAKAKVANAGRTRSRKP